MNNVLEEVGPFGLFQKISLTLIGCITCLLSMTFYVTIFNTAEPNLKCINFNNIKLNNETIDTCTAWNNHTNNLNSPFVCKFDDEYYGTTLVNDWQLVCDKSYLVALSQTLFLLGGVSGFISGFISDKYGRKKASLIFLVIFQVSVIVYNILITDLVGLSYSNRLIVYNAYQFINGALNVCVFSSIYVLLIELTTCDYHTLFSNINIYFYVIGEVIIMGVYFLSKNWRISNIFIACYSFVFIVLFAIFVPESPM